MACVTSVQPTDRDALVSCGDKRLSRRFAVTDKIAYPSMTSTDERQLPFIAYSQNTKYHAAYSYTLVLILIIIKTLGFK